MTGPSHALARIPTSDLAVDGSGQGGGFRNFRPVDGGKQLSTADLGELPASIYVADGDGYTSSAGAPVYLTINDIQARFSHLPFDPYECVENAPGRLPEERRGTCELHHAGCRPRAALRGRDPTAQHRRSPGCRNADADWLWPADARRRDVPALLPPLVR